MASKRSRESPQGEGEGRQGARGLRGEGKAGRGEGRGRGREGRVPGVGGWEPAGYGRAELQGKYAGHVGGRAGGARSWVPSRPAAVEEGPWLQGQGLEGEAREGEVRPALGGSRPGLAPHWAGALGSPPASVSQVPGETHRCHYHVGNADPESGTQGKLRYSNHGGAPPPKRHLIQGDLQETSKLRAAAAAAEGGTRLPAPAQLP